MSDYRQRTSHESSRYCKNVHNIRNVTNNDYRFRRDYLLIKTRFRDEDEEIDSDQELDQLLAEHEGEDDEDTNYRRKRQESLSISNNSQKMSPAKLHSKVVIVDRDSIKNNIIEESVQKQDKTSNGVSQNTKVDDKVNGQTQKENDETLKKSSNKKDSPKKKKRKKEKRTRNNSSSSVEDKRRHHKHHSSSKSKSETKSKKKIKHKRDHSSDKEPTVMKKLDSKEEDISQPIAEKLGFKDIADLEELEELMRQRALLMAKLNSDDFKEEEEKKELDLKTEILKTENDKNNLKKTEDKPIVDKAKFIPLNNEIVNCNESTSKDDHAPSERNKRKHSSDREYIHTERDDSRRRKEFLKNKESDRNRRHDRLSRSNSPVRRSDRSRGHNDRVRTDYIDNYHQRDYRDRKQYPDEYERRRDRRSSPERNRGDYRYHRDDESRGYSARSSHRRSPIGGDDRSRRDIYRNRDYQRYVLK